MGKRDQIQARIVASGIVAIIRLETPEHGMRIVDALAEGGLEAIEVTATTPGYLDILVEMTKRFGDRILVGAGTIIDPAMARSAVQAGARFLVSPTFKQTVVEEAHRHDVVSMPGCFTPTEILTAHEAGADFIKLFPAAALGPGYVRDVLAPLPQVRIIPTGGVDTSNVGEYFKAGVAAVGLGGKLLDKAAIAAGRFEVLTQKAAELVAAVAAARRGAGEAAPR